MIKKFSEIEVGARFFVDNIEYIKTQAVKVSCCVTINAEETNNPAVKKFFQDDLAVRVDA